MGMDVAVVMGVIMGMVVSHGELLYYNITGVHARLSRVSLLESLGPPCLGRSAAVAKAEPSFPSTPIPRRLNAATDDGDQFLR
jgi:hypothetical protein